MRIWAAVTILIGIDWIVGELGLVIRAIGTRRWVGVLWHSLVIVGAIVWLCMVVPVIWNAR